MPLNVLPSMVFGCIIYWLANLNPHTFGPFLGILLLHSLAALSLGLLVSALSPTVEVANVVGPPVIIVLILFSGYYINIGSLPIVANLVPYISFIKWTFEAFNVNEFVGETFSCQGTGGCYRTGEQVLQHLTFGGQTNPNHAVFGLSMCFIGLLVVAYLSLEFSRISYLPLGHEGRKFKAYFKYDSPRKNPDAEVADVEAQKKVPLKPELPSETP